MDCHHTNRLYCFQYLYGRTFGICSILVHLKQEKVFFQLKMSKEFFTIVAIIFIGQVVIVEGLYDFFNCTPMKLMDWVIIVVLSSLVLWARELWHLLTKRG